MSIAVGTRWNLCGLLISCGLLSPFVVFAQQTHDETSLNDSPSDVDPEQLYQLAKIYYNNREWEKAAQTLEVAFGLDPHPILAHNCAKAYENAGDMEKAEKYYRICLEMGPDDDTRERTEIALTRIENTRRALNMGEVTEQQTSLLEIHSEPSNAYIRLGEFMVGKTPYQGRHPPGRYSVVVEHDGYRPYHGVVELEAGEELILRAALNEVPPGRVWTWVAAGTSAALLATAIVFSVEAQATYDQLNDANVRRDDALFNDLKQEGQDQLVLSYVFYGLAAGALIGAIVLFFVEAPEESALQYEEFTTETAIQVWISPVGGIGVHGVF